jgi:hypothetical protein
MWGGISCADARKKGSGKLPQFASYLRKNFQHVLSQTYPWWWSPVSMVINLDAIKMNIFLASRVNISSSKTV